jgi:hypothetical protein
MIDFGISVSGVPNINDSIVVHFSPEYVGMITIAKPTKLTSIKFNQFDKSGDNIISNYYINDGGNVIAGKPDVSTNTYGII